MYYNIYKNIFKSKLSRIKTLMTIIPKLYLSLIKNGFKIS